MSKLDEFQLGLLAMGYTLKGIQGHKDFQTARDHFSNVTVIAPEECDGWIGRIYAGDATQAVIYNAWKTKASINALAREIDLDAVGARLDIGSGLGQVALALKTPEAVSFSQAIMAIASGDYAWAEEIFTEELEESLLQTFGLAYLAYVTQQWPVILQLTSRSVDVINDENLVSADAVNQILSFLSGVACAYLGMNDEAIRRLDNLDLNIVSEFHRDYYLALLQRAKGDEDKARGLLQKIYAVHPTETIMNLIEDKYQVIKTVTPESIAARTNKYDPESSVADELQEEEIAIESEKLLQKALKELHDQIGLAEVKHQVERLKKQAILKKVREGKGIAVYSSSNSLIFSGPPGTGKTTIARIVKDIYRSLGIVTTDKFVEARKKDLVAEYLGQTEAKTSKVLDSALDGVLFIDEVHTLADDQFGIIAAKEIMARMENERDRLVVIIAGYNDDVDKFLMIDDGLKSRFSQRIRFQSYTPDELVEIGEFIAHKRDNLLDEEAKEVLYRWIGDLSNVNPRTGRPRLDEEGNARFIRNVIENAERERDDRIFNSDMEVSDAENLTAEEIQTITADDMNKAVTQVLQTGKSK